MITQEYDFSLCNYTIEATEEFLRATVRSRYNEIDASQIFEALSLAYLAHDAQLRCDNVPFIIHPMRVALMLVKYDRSIISKVFIAALLHDTLEDTWLKSFEIEEKFGKYVAKLVQAVTRRHDTKNLQEKREAKLQHWQEIMQGSHEVRIIKTFEDLDNIICWKAIPQEGPDQKKIPRWLEETREMSLPLAHATNMQAHKLMQLEYSYYVKQGYGDQPITA